MALPDVPEVMVTAEEARKILFRWPSRKVREAARALDADLAARARDTEQALANGDRLLSQAGRQLEAAEADLAARARDAEAMLNATLAQPVHLVNRELRERVAELEQVCEKAIRERRSLESKEDDWHSAYERSERRVAELEAALRQALEHMEFAYYPQTGDGPHLADPFDLMDKMRALTGDGGGGYDLSELPLLKPRKDGGGA